jgi:hypothetical protein
MTQNGTPAKAPTDAEWMAGYDQHLADQAAALLASLPKRRVRARKVAK